MLLSLDYYIAVIDYELTICCCWYTRTWKNSKRHVTSGRITIAINVSTDNMQKSTFK